MSKISDEEALDYMSKSFFVEKDVENFVVKFEGKEKTIKEYLENKAIVCDTILRAQTIITSNVEESKLFLDEALELYEFLISDDENNSWRKVLPTNREFIEIDDLCFES